MLKINLFNSINYYFAIRIKIKPLAHENIQHK